MEQLLSDIKGLGFDTNTNGMLYLGGTRRGKITARRNGKFDIELEGKSKVRNITAATVVKHAKAWKDSPDRPRHAILTK